MQISKIVLKADSGEKENKMKNFKPALSPLSVKTSTLVSQIKEAGLFLAPYTGQDFKVFASREDWLEGKSHVYDCTRWEGQDADYCYVREA